MNIKLLVHRFYNYLYNYILFIPDEDHYDDNNSHIEHEESFRVLKKQKYSTWLYTFLLIGKLKIQLIIESLNFILNILSNN